MRNQNGKVCTVAGIPSKSLLFLNQETCKACAALKKEMERVIELYGCELVLELKKYTNTAQLRRYEKVKRACDKRSLISKDYEPGCLKWQRKYLVDHSDIRTSYRYAVTVWSPCARAP